MQIANIINTFLQAFLLSYLPYYFIKKDLKDKENSYSKVLVCTILLTIFIIIVSNNMGSSFLSVFVLHVLTIMIVSVFNGENKVNATIAYSLVYCILQISVLACGNIYWSLFKNISSSAPMFASTVLMYFPQYILTFFILKYKESIYEIYRSITKKSYYKEIILIFSFMLDYILSIAWIIYGNDDGIFNILFIGLLIALMIMGCKYVTSLQKRVHEIDMLNKSINNKNDELRKTKHDYGSQISYLYGLCLMKKHDRVEELLKEIINKNNSNLNDIEFNCDSIISISIKSLVPESVHVVIDEEFDLDELNISEYELQKIISNIVVNAVCAMNGVGIITIKTYKIFHCVYLVIQNTGSKISPDIIDKIFRPGFTTKDCKDNGFGLSIVKELVEHNNGKVFASSNDKYTEFKICFDINE